MAVRPVRMVTQRLAPHGRQHGLLDGAARSRRAWWTMRGERMSGFGGEVESAVRPAVERHGRVLDQEVSRRVAALRG